MTPLHIAFEEGNNRSINLILRYMAKIKYNASESFKDILPQLVDYNDFPIYLDSLRFQSI
jgi:hypothetical protein